MSISSPGLASGLDIKGIVSQLVALERAPLTGLQKQVSSHQARLSVYGTVRSLVTSLGEVGARLAAPDAFQAVKASSSLPESVGVSVRTGAPPTAFSVEVVSLAKAQSLASAAVPTGSGVGAGTLTFTLGTWNAGTFSAGTGTPVSVTIEPGKDSLGEIAAQINKATAGVTATVLKDASGERLLLRSAQTGAAQGFEVSALDGDANDGKDLTQLAYQSGVGSGVTLTQGGADAVAKVNGVDITSASNTVQDALPGVTLTLLKPTTTAAEVAIDQDKEAMRKTVQAFVDAYNALEDLLSNTTQYNPDTKVAGSLQGDGTAVGLRNAVRAMMRTAIPGGALTRLNDAGLSLDRNGRMTVDSARLDAALEKPQELTRLFGAESTDPTAQGFGRRLKTFADGLVDSDGTITTRTDSLRRSIQKANKEMDKVIERASRAEARYLAQYTAMDAQVARLNSLNAYVAQQVTLWNKNSAG